MAPWWPRLGQDLWLCHRTAGWWEPVGGAWVLPHRLWGLLRTPSCVSERLPCALGLVDPLQAGSGRGTGFRGEAAQPVVVGARFCAWTASSPPKPAFPPVWTAARRLEALVTLM